MNWAGCVLVAMLGLGLITNAAKHGKPRAPYKFDWGDVVSVFIILALYWKAGVFGH